jgi:hypothetical protein
MGSLYDIMRDYSGTSLFVLPICWTDLHAELLGARFVELDPILSPVPGPRHCGWNACGPSQTAASLSRELTTLLSAEITRPYCKTRAIKNIMSTLFPSVLSRPKSSAELDMFFGGRVYRKAVRLPVLWKYSDSTCNSFDSASTRPAASFGKLQASSSSLTCIASANQPMLAYVDRTHLAAIRQNLFRICPGPPDGDRLNLPVLRLQRLRSKPLVPTNADHDAYYVSILLAMAQAHFYEEAAKPSSQSSSRSGFSGKSIDMLPENFRDVKVQLLTHAENTADFVVYTAVVTATFLQRFARPSKAPETKTPGGDDGGIRIELTHVPVWPVLGLKERLGKALGRDIAGDAVFGVEDDGDGLETWENSEERRQRMAAVAAATASLKRRRAAADREILAEVFNKSNSSFEVDDDDCASSCASDDRPVLSPDAKRRRCTRTATGNPLEVC